jgi:flagellar biosynthetic protein FlhB
MPEDTGQSRSEAPTQRRREKARKEGQVATSADLSSGLLLLAGTFTLWIGGEMFGGNLLRMVRSSLLYALRTEWGIPQSSALAKAALVQGLSVAGPLLAVLFVIGAAVGVVQAGFQVSWKPLAPEWGRLSWGKGWKRLFSTRSLARGVSSVAKVTAVALLVLWVLLHQVDHVSTAGHGTVERATALGWRLAVLLGLAIAAAMVVIGLLDYLFQRWRHEQDLKMTRRELKEERREDEGDPHMRARIRKLQREVGQRRMMQEVPNASVVITNPTHIAVALQYERGLMNAPRVVAKGADLLAMQIRRIAERHGVPVLERKPLARALYLAVDVDQEIPAEFYHAIAEILAYIYRLNRAA